MAFAALLKNAVKSVPSQVCRNLKGLLFCHGNQHNIRHFSGAMLESPISRFCLQSQKSLMPTTTSGFRQFSSVQDPLLHPVAVHSPVVISVRHKVLTEMQKLYKWHYTKPRKPRPVSRPLDGRPQMKGIVLKTMVKKPKKPNSANRKCVLVRLSNGKEAAAYVPGIGHNLQEHNIVLVRCGRVQDVPGLKLKVIRGKYDCAHVIKKTVTPS